ncbi:MAG: glycosyltransferase family 4 protein [Actinomycetota bacterium]
MSTSRVRVLEVLGRSAGGIARHVAQLVGALDDHNGLVVDVACPPDLPLAMPKPLLPLVIPNGPRGHGAARRSLAMIARAGGYEVIHAHGLRAGVDAGLATLRSTPVLLTVHNLVRPDIAGRGRAWSLRWSEPLAVRLSMRTFAVSEEIATSLRSATPRQAHKIEVLHLGIGEAPTVERDALGVRSELGVADDDALIVTAARLVPQKALDVALRAVAALPRATLALFGEGPLRARLEEMTRALGIAERVRFMGWRDDLADHIAAADVFCLSSTWEGVPLAAQEAILLGTPVVATDVGGMGELIEDKVSGRLVPKGDAAALARALGDLLGAPAVARRYAERAGSDLAEKFSTARMLARLEEAYRAAARA